ncbi:MAG TPA: hypothetical protein VLH09_06980 [Bryobacteraceae bacterium]|nr:hypothetical protein [Bryobacteraceae bacterium]
MLLAYLRGWITSDVKKQGLRSRLRLELILSALAAELDAVNIRAQLATQSVLLTAVTWDQAKVTEIMEQVQQEVMATFRLQEMDFSEQIAAGSRSATVDYLFSLYQALLDAKVIPKANG